MVASMVALAVVCVLVVGPLLWRIWQDRRADQALAVRARVHAALVRALGGESLVAISVEPPAFWRPGRVELTAPSDWTFLLSSAWATVMPRVPADYELVVKPLAPAGDTLAPDLTLRRAA